MGSSLLPIGVMVLASDDIRQRVVPRTALDPRPHPPALPLTLPFSSPHPIRPQVTHAYRRTLEPDGLLRAVHERTLEEEALELGDPGHLQ